MGFWDNKKVLVTGGAGFVGSHVVDRLLGRGVPRDRVVVPRSRECDLRVLENCRRAVQGADVVVHLAAAVGGIGYSKGHPATQYYNCLLMDLHMVEAARDAGVEKFVSISSACAYPLEAPYPLREESLFTGVPQETNRAYGFAKSMMVAQAEAYSKQYGMNIAVLVGANAYGPRDNFHPEHSHVIPSLIRKCHEDREELVVWGDGTPTRDFLYVEDFAEGVLLAAERLEGWEPVNIGTGREISVRDLVAVIADLSGFRGRVRYDPSKPGGQPRRVISIDRARARMGFEPRTPLEEGLRRTIEWYRTTLR
jgi:GDP-L-fucose synthase